MRRWAGIFAVSGLGVEAATFALWPQYIDATLSLLVDTDGASVVESSHGGALGTFHMKIDTQSEIPLDPLIKAIEITWVPATDTQSSTFDHFLASSSRFDGMSAVGIHLQARLREEADWSAINKTRHKRIENNVRGVLQNTVPSFEILPSLSKGFLAKSFCDFRAWKTSNPLEEILRKPAAGSSSICYSSSFPFSPKSEGASFYSRAIRAANEDSVDFAAVQLLRLSRQSIWRRGLRDHPVQMDLSELLSQLARRDGKRVVPASPPSVLEIRAPKTTVVASLQAAIAGEGFHRRYAMDVEILESEVCGGFSKNKMILVREPISNTAYIDLDEIRRMERFGELKLLSFTKHIEIERPSPVSSQHVVGLEFIMPSNNQAHFEFPIHFRYQAPSESELYRQAPVIAPDIFLFCRDGDNSAREKRNPSDDDAAFSYFKTWGLSDRGVSRSGSHWLRLTAVSPLPVVEILTPVGYLPSAWLVSSMTLFFSTMGAAILVWVSVGMANAQSASACAGVSWKGKAD
ncbi:hypothetical protein PI124_g6642 [Phytophthora idaei]|nr:hypothetical protein PI125_g6162 [Phytophthora idaei]KAG3162548.1 hypothetical protein PI126_g5940 [Phytophthora idaei]KAG3248701.1 hypothetical protein PI124_g6642 [Phytophthora idaei]